AKLARMGVAVSADEIITSPQATAEYLSQHEADARIYVVGSPSLGAELRARSLVVVGPDEVATANCVVVGGIVGYLTYEHLAGAGRTEPGPAELGSADAPSTGVASA